jgi:hypothetical protein
MDTTTPLNQIEAGRVRTELERIKNARPKYRELIGYSPEQIAETLKGLKVKPEDIARYAMRDE